MRYRLLGRSGLRVTELCLGAMTLSDGGGWTASADESKKIFTAYVDAGGNFIDTANNYSLGLSERLIGEFISERRDQFVVATKYTSLTRREDPNSGGNHRKSLVAAVEGSLERLGTDYIDLLWVHVWDGVTPVEEVMRGLDDLISAGKVLYIGVSDVPAWVVAQANTLAELRGWTPFVGLQGEYSLIERSAERDLAPMANELGLTLLAWGALGGGLLSGKYQEGNGSGQGRLSAGSSRLTPRNMAIVDEVVKVAAELDASPAQVALNWLGAKRDPAVIPIVGARTANQVKENLASLDLELSDDQIERLNQVSEIDLGFPHEFLARIRERYAGSLDR
jgi:aryl-alcohol dehydrogenase-like predicted oxidoreductase